MEASLNQAQLKRLKQGIKQLPLEENGIKIPEQGLTAIEQHLALLIKWHKKINLVSFEAPDTLISHHALDSLALLPFLKNSQRILDFGTGAGFPGMPLAAAMPEAQFTLLDSRLRRIEFLRMVVTEAKLKNVNLVNARVEAYLKNESEKPALAVAGTGFDTLVVRAVASLAQLFRMTSHLHRKGMRLIAMKGQLNSDEISAFEQQSAQHNVSIQIEKLDVPFLDAERHALILHL